MRALIRFRDGTIRNVATQLWVRADRLRADVDFDLRNSFLGTVAIGRGLKMIRERI